MKTMFTPAAVLVSVAILSLAGIGPAVGDEQRALSQKTYPEKTCKGKIIAVDQNQKIATVKGFIFHKTFNLADTCRVVFEDKPEASLADLRPGQQVEVQFQNVHGVLIADQVTQQNLVFRGHIATLDPTQRTLVVSSRGSTKHFVLPEDGAVVLRKDKAGSIAGLEIGQTVEVIYESPNGSTVARRIEQQSERFVGTIQALDAGTRTVKAKRLLTEKEFNLANDCQIVVENKPNADLQDLRIGDRVEFDYIDANGVLVANRIGRDANSLESESTPTARINN